jgi:TrmH family RNA methyltransferase
MLCCPRQLSITCRLDAVLMKTIKSRQNPLVARFRSIARAHRLHRQQILLEGTKLIHDARAAGIQLEVVVLPSSELKNHNRQIIKLADELESSGVSVVTASDSVLSALSPVKSPSGSVAIATYKPASLNRVFGRNGLVLAPIGVQDPGNVGAIIRAADAGGASGVIVTSESADPFGWRALRGAMGSSLRLPVADINNVHTAVEEARKRGFGVIAAIPKGGTSLYSLDLTKSSLILIGNEGSGLDNKVESLADRNLQCPCVGLFSHSIQQ